MRRIGGTGASAALARAGEEIAGLLRALRGRPHARSLMSEVLEAIARAADAEGVVLVRASADEPREALYRHGAVGALGGKAAGLLRRARVGTPMMGRDSDERSLAVSICHQDAAETVALLLWRGKDASAWTTEDAAFVDASAGILWLVLDRETSRTEYIRSLRTDPVTALLNRRTFVAEASRHIGRLTREEAPATLLLAEIDNLPTVIATLGTEGGDQMLRRAAVLLQNTVRPTDLVGRIGDAEFAVWLTGADHMTAAERAESLCLVAPKRIAGPDHARLPDVSFSIGIAARRAGERYDDVARRANAAKHVVKKAGGGHWRVSLCQSA